MSKTAFAQYDPFGSRYTEQCNVWLDDVKTFHHRPMRCVIVVHPYSLAQEDTALLTGNSLLSSRVQKYAWTTHVSLQTCTKTSGVTLNKRQKNEISNNAALITETNQVMWSLLTNAIPHGRTIMYMVIPATEASMMAVGCTFLQEILILERTDCS